jgi:hypothetical protein
VGVGAEGVEKSGAICGAPWAWRAIDIFTIAAGLAEGVGRSRKGTKAEEEAEANMKKAESEKFAVAG